LDANIEANIRAGILQILKDKYHYPRNEIKNDLKLKFDLGFDSLTLVNLIIDIEDTFGIVFDDSLLDPSTINSIGELISLVNRSEQDSEFQE